MDDKDTQESSVAASSTHRARPSRCVVRHEECPARARDRAATHGDLLEARVRRAAAAARGAR